MNNNIINNDIIVYTCITNGKNELLEYEKEDGVGYICFTDYSIKQKGQWKLFDIGYINSDPRRTARFYKLNPQLVLPKHKTSIWIDGSLLPRVKIRDLVNWFGDAEYGVRKHPGWDCIYKEAKAILGYGYDDVEVIRRVVARYRDERYPENYGLHETGVLIRKSNTENMNFDKFWWKEVNENSKRDQMSFDYLRWKLDFKIRDIPREWFTQVPHKHMR